MMFALSLSVRQCIGCGICMDVCKPQALKMRVWHGRTVEGPRVAAALAGESDAAATLTWPYLAFPERCDACLRCVDECPVTALALQAAVPRERNLGSAA
jgi:ferredoxin